MNELFLDSVYFGAVLTITSYLVGAYLQRRLRKPFLNPLLISILLIILLLKACHVSYDAYNGSAQYISYLLTPATVCLAVPLYEQLALLKSHWKAILTGIFCGVLASLGSTLGLCTLFGFTHTQYVTMLPKSITTAIGMGVSEELGGVVTITVAVIIITGILGNILAASVCRLFRITDPVAKGIGIGSASHAIGTVKAMEMGDIEGAMSSLSIAVAGLMTVVGASVFANFM